MVILVFLHFATTVPHTVISNSEKLTHPNVHYEEGLWNVNNKMCYVVNPVIFAPIDKNLPNIKNYRQKYTNLTKMQC